MLLRRSKIPLIFKIIVIYLGFTHIQAFAANQQEMTINSGSSAPMIISNNVGFYPEIIKEIFSRLNIQNKTMLVPSSASLKNANQGIDDGLIARVKGVNKKLKNIIPVEEKVIDLRFVAYSHDKNVKINKWADLKNYNVGYIRGWKIFDKNVTLYKSLLKVKNTKQLFRLLEKKRVDVILHQDLPSRYMMKKLNYFPYEQKASLAKREMFIYMHKRHALLVPQMSMVLKEMKKEGVYQTLYEKYISNVIDNSINLQKSNSK